MLELSSTAKRFGLPAKPLVEKAIAYYWTAVQRYPTSVELRVQLAAAAALDKQWPLAEKHIQEAVNLSAISPHEDKRLGRDQQIGQGAGDQMIWFPVPGLPSALQAGPPNMVLAEPLIEWIRTQSTVDDLKDN